MEIDDERILSWDQNKTPAQVLQEYCTRHQTSVEFQDTELEDPNGTDKKLFKIAGTVNNLTSEVILNNFFFRKKALNKKGIWEYKKRGKTTCSSTSLEAIAPTHTLLGDFVEYVFS